jgi:hypothetical protein
MIRNRAFAVATVLACVLASSVLPAHAAPTGYRFELVGKPQLSGQKGIVQVRLVHATGGKHVPDAVIFESTVDMGPAVALVTILTLPIGVLMAFAGMHGRGIGTNVMSLGGSAIALGAMVDAAIVMIENAHKHGERLERGEPRGPALIAAAKEVGPSLFSSLLVIVASFLPIFALEDQEGRLFKPLADTKTFAMAGGAILAVTLVPVLMLLFVRGRIVPEARNLINRALICCTDR